MEIMLKCTKFYKIYYRGARMYWDERNVAACEMYQIIPKFTKMPTTTWRTKYSEVL